ncbi:hypothetical protein ACVIJU_003138 [Aeribacillus sp. SP014]
MNDQLYRRDSKTAKNNEVEASLTLPLQSYLLGILIEKTINLQTIRPLTLQFLVFVCLFLVYRHNNGYFSE